MKIKSTYKLKCLLLFCAAICFGILLSCTSRNLVPPVSTSDNDTIKFAIISDFHFDPFLNTSSTWTNFISDTPITAANFTNILDQYKSECTSQSYESNEDSSFGVIYSAITNLAQRDTNLSFVLCPGDFVLHRDKLANELDTNGIDRSLQTNVIRRCEEFVPLLLAHGLKAPVFPVLGNNDSDIKDYREPSPALFAELTNSWAACMHSNYLTSDFMTNGYYEASLPGLINCHLLAFNSTVFHPLDHKDSQEATNTLIWLKQNLANNQSKVILLYHIPPGRDYFNTNHYNYSRDFQSRFLDDMTNSKAEIIASFCGHTHCDEFREIQPQTPQSMLIHISSSISPVYGQLPAYQVFTTRPNGEILDYTTYHLTNAPDGLSWQPEYSFYVNNNLPWYSTNYYYVAATNGFFANPDAEFAQKVARFYSAGSNTVEDIANTNSTYWQIVRINN